MKDSIRLKVLGSSSSGNSTLVWTDEGAVLVDIGFSQRYMNERLSEAGLPFEAIKAVLITHLHGDHINRAMLNKVLREQIPVYLHRRLRPELVRRFKIKDRRMLRVFEADPFEAGPFTACGFQVPHDSFGGCFAYNLHNSGKKISIATDMGFPENGLAESFKDSDLIIIESNHDPDLLANSGRSAELIERIRGIGHLSNEQCVRFLDDVLQRSAVMPQAVILAHLSSDCNLPRLAEQGVSRMLQSRSLNTTHLQVSQKNAPSETILI